MEEQNKSKTGIIWTVVILIVAIAAYFVFRWTKQDDYLAGNPTSIPTPTTPTPVPTPTPVTPTSRYKDGTYSAVGEYISPGGEESINLTLTLKNDVIVDAQVVSNAIRPNSVIYQGKFISGYKTLVVGKNIDNVALTKVSGSSLTPKGFADALAKIKVQAAA